MGWVDPEYIPILQQDHRYARLLNLTRRLLEERVPRCGNCIGGVITIRDDQGNETTVQCSNCQATAETGTLADNEDNGRAAGER
ncbi:hypothetical protein [Streptomyces hundungensis]|uniref:hypothetical protein n=1 Tax=Streptomyces hundungensis TaxID=1077946 RepID=UPI0033F9F45D